MFLLGALLGPIGLIIVAVMKPSTLEQIEAKPGNAGWYADPLGRDDGPTSPMST